MSEQNLQISIIEIRDLSSVVININDVSSVIINIQNRVKKYNINDNIILSKNQLTKYRLNKQLDKYKYIYENPDVLKCICYLVMFTIFILIFIAIKKT
tara:strand:+ start:917 stop:1210 length:294 start_codon:yes stop_codon:yes gene_type:complete